MENANKKNISIRLGDLRDKVDEVSKMTGFVMADIVRFCTKKALPIVEKHFQAMQADFETQVKAMGGGKKNQPKKAGDNLLKGASESVNSKKG